MGRKKQTDEESDVELDPDFSGEESEPAPLDVNGAGGDETLDEGKRRRSKPVRLEEEIAQPKRRGGGKRGRKSLSATTLDEHIHDVHSEIELLTDRLEAAKDRLSELRDKKRRIMSGEPEEVVFKRKSGPPGKAIKFERSEPLSREAVLDVLSSMFFSSLPPELLKPDTPKYTKDAMDVSVLSM